MSALKERVAEEEALPVVTPPIELPPPSPPPARPALVKHVAAPLPSPSPLTPPEVTPEIPAVSGYAPPPAPLHTSLAEESAALTDALSTLRVKHEPAVALEKLAAYQQRFPAGALRHEAALATVEAHRALGHTAEALSALEQLPRRAELDVLRAELNAELGRCDAARAALKGLNPTGALRERAVFTDATCALTLGSRDEAKALLTGLPESARARELLEKLQP